MDDEYARRDMQEALDRELDRLKEMLLTPAEKRRADFFGVVFSFLIVIISELFFG